jgi:hypothetical protein
MYQHQNFWGFGFWIQLWVLGSFGFGSFGSVLGLGVLSQFWVSFGSVLGLAVLSQFWVSFGFGCFGSVLGLGDLDSFGVWFEVLVLVFFSDYCNEAIHRASQTSHNVARVKKTSLY